MTTTTTIPARSPIALALADRLAEPARVVIKAIKAECATLSYDDIEYIDMVERNSKCRKTVRAALATLREEMAEEDARLDAEAEADAAALAAEAETADEPAETPEPAPKRPTVKAAVLAVRVRRDALISQAVEEPGSVDPAEVPSAFADAAADERAGVVKAVAQAIAAVVKAATPVEVREPTAEEAEALAKAEAKRALREARAAYECVAETDMTPRDEDTNEAVAKCPHCGTVCKGEDAIEEVFGIRKMKAFDDEAGTYKLTIRVQSYCKGCRSKHAKARRLAAQAA